MDDARAPGANPLQRLVLLTAILSVAGDQGKPALELADLLGFGGTPESRRESLAREIRKLRDVGIEITNVADVGGESRWVLHPRDSRVRLAFSPEQLGELARAALLADRRAIAEGLGAAGAAPAVDQIVVQPGARPEALDPVMRAVSARCLLRFTYNGRGRLLDPGTLVRDAEGWAVTGWDRHRAELRTYHVARMSDVTIDAPGTAGDVLETAARRGSDPLTWQMDEPVRAVLSGPSRYQGDVRRLLGPDLDVRPVGDGAEYTTMVTNRWVFLARVIELGERVRLDGLPVLRAELADRLRAWVSA